MRCGTKIFGRWCGSPATQGQGPEADRLAMRVAHPRRPPAMRPVARLHLLLDPALVLGDPRFGIGFGVEPADPCRVAVRDLDLDTERSIIERDHAIGRLRV